MGCWDELCLICGISGNGPRALVPESSLDEEAAAIAKDILANESHDETDEGLQRIVGEGLAASISDNWTARKPWMPRGLQGYSEMCSVAIGHFDALTGECNLQDGKFPSGKTVEVRRVASVDSGSADQVIRVVDGKEVAVDCYSHFSSRDRNPNIAVCGHCYHYLEAWLEWGSFPPCSHAFPRSREPLSYAGELYEIVNSRGRRRSTKIPATLPEIDYDGITGTLSQWQDFYIGARRGAKNTAMAIQAGLRGPELVPALLRDARAWMFTLVNLYPEPSWEDTTPVFTIYSPSADSMELGFSKLPNELLLLVLVDIPLAPLLALASTCRFLRALILDSSFLDLILRESITSGALQWLLPVEAVKNDEKRAYEAVRLWFPEGHRPEPLVAEPTEDEDECEIERWRVIPPVKPLFASPHFPRLAFIRKCWDSDSMMNRKQLWGQAKQFDNLWRDYRTHGWRVNRFYSSRPSSIDKATQAK